MKVCRRFALMPLAVYVGFALLLLLPRAAVMPLMDRDEPKFAQATQEMMQRGEWLVPYFNGEYRFDKPILVYWMMRLSDGLLGHTEAAARLHSVVCAVLVAWLLFFMGNRWFGRAAGWASGLAWLFTVQVLIHGQLCVADMALMLGIVMTQFGALELIRNPGAKLWGGWFWLMVWGVAVGFLAKGPLGVLVPLLGWLLTLWPLRGRIPRQCVEVFAVAIVLGLGIVAVWGIPALLQTDGEFYRTGIGEHVVKRGEQSFNGRNNIPLVYYLVTSIFVFLPWSAWFPALFRKREVDPLRRLLWGWFLVPFAIFTFYATQLPHYVLPSLPAMILLLFSSGHLPRPEGWWEIWWRRSVMGILGVVLVAFLVLGVMYPSGGVDAGLKNLFLGLSGWLGGIWLIVCFAGRGWRVGWLVPSVGLLVAGGSGAAFALRDVNPVLRVVRLMGERVGTNWLPREEEPMLVGCRFFEPSLVYYTNRKWVNVNKFQRVTELLREQEGPVVAVFLRRSWKTHEWVKARLHGIMPEPNRDFRAKIILPGPESDWEVRIVSGFNGALNEWNEILVARRR